MADFDDKDFDIDELLDEIDSSGTKGKGKAAEAPAPESGSGASSLEKKPSAFGSSGSKSVRFTDHTTEGNDPSGDDFISKVPRSQRDPPSASLRTMLFSGNETSSKSQPPPNSALSKPPLPPSTGRSARSSAPTSATSVKDDWLGIQDGAGSLTNSPPSSLPTRRSGPALSTTSEPNLMMKPATTENSSEEEDALFQNIGLSRQTGGRRPTFPDQTQQKPPQQLPLGPQRRPGFDSNPTTPPMSLGSQDKPMGPPKSTFSTSILDQLGMNSASSTAEMKSTSKHPPLPSPASLLGQSAPMMPSTSTIFYSEPQAPPKPQGNDMFSAFSLTAPPAPSPSQGAKKKVVKKDGVIASSVSSTLQLPTHIINEEELKVMSASLNTLYKNQLKMLEKSYQEQMEFLTDANKRKEDLLKQEMKGMQMDYEERLERLRNELREMEEQRQVQKETNSQHDASALATLSEQLNTSIENVREVLLKSQNGLSEEGMQVLERRIQNVVVDSLERQKEHSKGNEEKVESMVKSIDETVTRKFGLMNDAWRNLLSQVKQNMTDVMEASASNANHQSYKIMQEEMRKSEKNILGQLEIIGGLISRKEDASPKVLSKLDESEKMLLAELTKLQKLQRKTKESTDGNKLEPLIKLMEFDRDDEQKRLERLSIYLKELRRDLKRILIDNEGRVESTQKFSTSTEVELKSISQSIRDLNSHLKFSLITGPNHPEAITNQFASSMQQTQAEMEMKLLREERHALSESMAQMNVEKRKLSEDMVQLGKQKLDFQKERDQLRNLEIQLKTKLEEAEELQKKTESVRKEEIQLTSEAQYKLKELQKEKQAILDKLQVAEQRLRIWDHNLRQDKADLLREREIIERLRDQLLCPGCLKANQSVGVHPPPPPYVPVESVAHQYFNSRLNSSSGGGTSSEDIDNYFSKLFD